MRTVSFRGVSHPCVFWAFFWDGICNGDCQPGSIKINSTTPSVRTQLVASQLRFGWLRAVGFLLQCWWDSHGKMVYCTYMNGLNEWDQRRYNIQSSHGSYGVMGVEPGIFVSRYLDLFVFVGDFFFYELCHGSQWLFNPYSWEHVFIFFPVNLLPGNFT